MSEGTLFFSYSRQDSDFVLHLAKSLREAGATVWLDKLDIKPGSRWDKSIEKALFRSKTLIVVLSKASVNSQNVLDEVSYALEEKKQVVPILLEDCDIPFRLRRLQFADFTKDKKQALNTLILSLGLDPVVAHKFTDTAVEHNLVDKEESKEFLPKLTDNPGPVVKKPNDKVQEKPKIERKRISKKGILLVAGIVVGVISIFALVGYFSKSENPEIMPISEDLADWNRIKDGNEVQLFQNHLQFYEQCIHEQEAASKIHSLEAIKDVKDSIVLDSIEPIETLIDEEKLSVRIWDSIKNIDKFESYFDYYRNLDSKFKAEAEEKIKNALTQSGYVYFGRTNSNYFNPLYPPTNSNAPDTSSFYISSRALTVRGSSDKSSSLYESVKGTVKDGSLVFIDEVIPSGNSFWIKIRFKDGLLINSN